MHAVLTNQFADILYFNGNNNKTIVVKVKMLTTIIVVYMHNYTCPKSCIPQIWPENFRIP